MGCLEIGTMAEFIYIQVGFDDTYTSVELNLENARLVRDILVRAIRRIEAGATVAPSFDSFLQSVLGG